MRRSRPIDGVHIHWSEARSGWLMTSSATPLTSAGEVKRKIDLLAPYEPSCSEIHDFFDTLLLPPLTSSTPSYRCELARPRRCPSSTIWRASCATSGTAMIAANSVLLILERLYERTPHRRFRRQNRRGEGRPKDHGQQQSRNAEREMIPERYSGE